MLLAPPKLLAPSMLALLRRVPNLRRPPRYCRALCTAPMLGRKRIGDSLHPALVGGKQARCRVLKSGRVATYAVHMGKGMSRLHACRSESFTDKDPSYTT